MPKHEIRTKIEAKLNKLEEKSIELMKKELTKALTKLINKIEQDSLDIEHKFEREREKEKLKGDLTHLFYSRMY